MITTNYNRLHAFQIHVYFKFKWIFFQEWMTYSYNLLETRIYGARINLKYGWFHCFISPICAVIEAMWYLMMWSLWWSSHNFETILFCDRLTVFCLFDLQKIEVTSIFEINFWRLDLQGTITIYCTDKLCNVTPSDLTNNTHVLLLQENTAHVDDHFRILSYEQNSYMKKYDPVVAFERD